MQTVYNTTATAEARANVDKWLETYGFVPRIEREIIYYLLDNRNYSEVLEQFSTSEATQRAYTLYLWELYQDDLRKDIYAIYSGNRAWYGSEHTPLPDSLIRGLISFSARYLFEMIKAKGIA